MKAKAKGKFLASVIAAAILSLGVAACGEDDNKSTSTGDQAAQTSEPSVEIVSPTEGDSADGPVKVEVKLENFELAGDAVGMAAEDGKGHLHFSLDGGKYDQPKYSGANGKLAKDLGVNGQYSPSVTETITYDNLPAGEHTLKVALANNDHSDAGVTDEVKFTVGDSGSASIELLEPENGATVGQPVTFKVDVGDFKLNADAVGKAPKKGEGHLHFALDGGKFDQPKYSGANGELAKKLGVNGKYSPAVEPTITYEGLPSGEHTLEVYLAENNHENGPSETFTFTVE